MVRKHKLGLIEVYPYTITTHAFKFHLYCCSQDGIHNILLSGFFESGDFYLANFQARRRVHQACVNSCHAMNGLSIPQIITGSLNVNAPTINSLAQ